MRTLPDDMTLNDIMVIAEHLYAWWKNCCQNYLLMFLVNHALKVYRSCEWYKELKYYLLPNDTSSRSMGCLFAVNPSGGSHGASLTQHSIHTAAWLSRKWERGIWCTRHIMESVAVTLSTYSAIKPRTKWTSSSVKSIRRSYKRIYGVCNGGW